MKFELESTTKYINKLARTDAGLQGRRVALFLDIHELFANGEGGLRLLPLLWVNSQQVRARFWEYIFAWETLTGSILLTYS